MYIAEQQMLAAAVGLQARGWRPFASTLRGVPLTRLRLRPHGRDQPGDDVPVAARTRASRSARTGRRRWRSRTSPCLRAVHGSTVLHPCDANQTAKLVAAMADLEGISYLRTLRPATPVLYGPDEEFEIGGSRVLRSSDRRRGLPRRRRHHRARGAEGGRRARRPTGSDARVIDLYSIKPIDGATLAAAAAEAGDRLITVEDHWPEGGLGDAVLGALAAENVQARVVKLAVRGCHGRARRPTRWRTRASTPRRS